MPAGGGDTTELAGAMHAGSLLWLLFTVQQSQEMTRFTQACGQFVIAYSKQSQSQPGLLEQLVMLFEFVQF